MISEYELQSGLDDYLAAAATALGLIVRWPGQAREGVNGAASPPSTPVTGEVGWVGKTTWIEPSVLSRTNRAISMMRGYEEDGGTYQIAIVSQVLRGPYPLHEVVDLLRPYYRQGSSQILSPSGRPLHFLRADPRPVFEAAGNLRLPMLVPFSVYAPG